MFKTYNFFCGLLIGTLVCCNNGKRLNPEELSTEPVKKSGELRIRDTIDQHGFPVILNGEIFDIELSKDTFCMLKRPDGDTVIKAENFYANLEILDINKDGFEDLRIFIFSNTDNQCDSYLYDPSVKTYRKIQNSSLNFEKLSNTDLYFEYSATGCADNNWESKLYKLEKFVLTPVGRIVGSGCSSSEQKIEIYQFDSDDKEVLIETLPYKKNIPEFGVQWDFIKRYWNEKYIRFASGRK